MSPTEAIVRGNWIDGFADGPITEEWVVPEGHVHQWSFPLTMGYVVRSGDYFCSECSAELTRNSADGLIGGVPPWTTDSEEYVGPEPPETSTSSPDGF